jgi:hypothetical protein
MDDILVVSRDEQTCLQHIRQLLEKLREFGQVLNLINCQFGRQHVAVINQFRQPTDSKGPQTFLRLVNFYLVILFFFLVLPALCSIWQTPCK